MRSISYPAMVAWCSWCCSNGPRRGPTLNNRWWNDRREWNLRRWREERRRPRRGRITPNLDSVRPLWGRLERELRLIRRLHSLRSFHQRLFTFAPVGDGGDMQDCEVHSLPLYHHCMMRCLQRRPGGRHKFRRGAAYACANTCNFLPIFTPRANLVPSGCAFITLLSYFSFSADDA